jgi:tRNA pseudouridine38-40 synthase
MDIEGNGFLWNMVRIIGGTLIDVGRRIKKAEDVQAILESRDRTRAGPTLPPTGLCLEWIKYKQ